MTHDDLWRALDTLAAENGLSVSGLARLAGLDPTVFNRSKRVGPHGPRWPGTESLSRVLAATGVGLDAFASLVSGARVLPSAQDARKTLLPLLEFSRMGGRAPADLDRETTRQAVPLRVASEAYLVRLDSDRFEPVLADGALLVMFPDMPARRGDRAIGFTGAAAVPCLVGAVAATRLDGAGPLPEGTVLHRIGWIGSWVA